MRRLLSAFLALFLLGAIAAPHRHRNDVADLVMDGPSDSGVFVDACRIARGESPVAERARWIDDDPCAACFSSDFVASEPARAISLAALPAIGRLDPLLFRGDRFLAVPLLGSRSPPRV